MYKDEATFIKTEISRLTKMDYDDVGIDKVRLAHLIRLDTASWRKTFQSLETLIRGKPDHVGTLEKPKILDQQDQPCQIKIEYIGGMGKPQASSSSNYSRVFKYMKKTKFKRTYH